MATHLLFLPGESQGRGSLVGCRLWGRTESDTTEGTQQQQQQQQHAVYVVFSLVKLAINFCLCLGRRTIHLDGKASGF